MNEQERQINDLVIANRILAHENVCDAYGHVSIRNPKNPKTFFMARSLAPELVTRDDIVELDVEGNPVREESRHLYLERFIHGGILEARPDVMSVVHAHAEDILPFGIADGTPLRPVIHSGSFIGAHVPVWDIADRFGDTNLLVANVEQGRDLFDWEARWRPVPGSDEGPIKRGAGFAFMQFRSGVGPSSAILRVDSSGRYTLYVGVTDIGPGAKTTMAMIAAEELGVPLDQVDVVWGDTDRCPYSVGESGSRTTTMTGYAVVQAAIDLKNQIATQGMPEGDAVLRYGAAATSLREVRFRVTAANGGRYSELHDLATGR